MMRGWSGLLVAFMLAGCASVPAPVAVTGLSQKAPLQFALDGRLAVHFRDQASTANLHWLHQPQFDKLTLSSPLGQTLVVLTRDQSGASLVDNEQKVYRAPTTTELSERILGWSLPLENLTYWVVGQAVPDQTSQTQLDPEHGLTRLMQAGWVVTYSRWQQVDGVNLPNKILLEGPDVAVRLVINEWKLGAAQ